MSWDKMSWDKMSWDKMSGTFEKIHSLLNIKKKLFHQAHRNICKYQRTYIFENRIICRIIATIENNNNFLAYVHLYIRICCVLNICVLCVFVYVLYTLYICLPNVYGQINTINKKLQQFCMMVCYCISNVYILFYIIPILQMYINIFILFIYNTY